MPKQLQKAINLAKKTGDRLIVYDMSKSDDAYVVMSLDEYEKLAIGRNEVKDLTEDELLDKINRDIAVWKNEQYNREEMPNDKDFVSVDDFEYSHTREDKEEERDVFDSSFYNKTKAEDEERKPKNHWAIPSKRKEGADEVIEEDRQYLEEIKF